MTNLEWMMSEIRTQVRSVRNQVSGLPKEAQEELSREFPGLFLTEIQEYAMKILKDSGCNEYSYGDKYADNILSDLKEAFKPGELKYPYNEVADAILSISRVQPRFHRAPFLMCWDTDDCADGIECESFGAAKCYAEDTLVEWACEENREWKFDGDIPVPTQEQIDSWDYMIYNFGVSIKKYNPETDEYEDYYEFDQDELDKLGWSLWEDLSARLNGTKEE